MADRRPLAYIDGVIGELPATDALDLGYAMPITPGSIAHILRSDGTDAYWGSANEVPIIGASEGDVLTWSGGTYDWAAASGGIEGISTDTDLYISTTGNDTTGDGSSGTPWATLDKAFEYLSDKIIFPPYYVTIHVEGGNYSDTDLLTVGHFNGSQIKIEGDYETDTTCSLTSMTGSAQNWTIVFTTSNPSYYTLNDFIMLTYATGGTGAVRVEGVHKVTGIAGSSITVTSKSDYGSAASGAVTFYARIPQARLNRKLEIVSNIYSITGLQIIYAPSTVNEVLVDVGYNPYQSVNIWYSVIASTTDQYGIALSLNNPGYLKFIYSGIANSNYGIYSQIGEVQFNRSVAVGCDKALYGIRKSLFYVYGDEATVVGNTTYGIYISDMSLGSFALTPVIAGNGTNYSPTQGSTGNGNSYMGT